MSKLTFRGIQKDYLTVLLGTKRPPWAKIKRNVLTLSKRPGGLLEDTDTEPRIIDVPVIIQAESFLGLQKIKEDLADWLITENPEELVFEDEPDRTYMAIVDGNLDLDEFVDRGQGVITFLCLDPFKYGTEKQVNFLNAGSFIVDGTVDALPIIEVTLKADTTYVAISNGEEINMIGNPVKQDETPFEPETPILIYGANNLTGWTNSSAVSIEGAEQSGVLKTDGNNLYTDNYGTGAGWHGPAMKTSLSSALQDFRVDVGFNMKTTGYNQAGGMTVNLLDANSIIVGTIAMTKHFAGIDAYYGRVRAGNSADGHDVLQENWASYSKGFDGVMRLWRRGDVWTAQVFYRVNGVFLPPVTHSWTDTNEISSAPITQVQARLLQRAAFPVAEQKIGDIKVYRLNDAAVGQVPIIAKAGDLVEFNHQNDIIRVNGEDITKEKAFIGEYFPLKPGQNTIIVEPMDSIENVKVGWRDQWR